MKGFWPGALMVLAACATNPTPVPVTGATADVQSLAGEWTGEYRSLESGRSGSILFVLGAGRDTAQGSVVMVAREGSMNTGDAMAEARTRYAANQVLTIRFVRVDGPVVSGTIDPYPGPDCNCQLFTVFRGTLRDNRIEGTFETRNSGVNVPTQQGSWVVTRSPPAPPLMTPLEHAVSARRQSTPSAHAPGARR